MPFPQSDRVIFEANPLVEVLCEIRCPTILRIEAELPVGFQERIRNQYPTYERGDVDPTLPAEVLQLLQSVDAPSPIGGPTHRFLTEDAKRFISLGVKRSSGQSFVALTEHDYQRWELFKPRVQEVEHHFAEEYSPAHYSRIGLRYKDRIVPAEVDLVGRSWRDLLNQSIAGLLAEPELSEAIDISSSIVDLSLDDEIPGCRMRIRYGMRTEPDSQVKEFIVDADCFKLGRVSRDELFGTLDKLNDIAGRFFRWSISDLTKQALRPTTLEPLH